VKTLGIKIVKEVVEGKTKTKRKMAFSKKLVVLFLVSSQIVTLVTLYLCYLCITLDYQGSLPFLSALIGLQEASLGFVCSKYLSKSVSENTKGGIVYDLALQNKETEQTKGDLV